MNDFVIKPTLFTGIWPLPIPQGRVCEQRGKSMGVVHREGAPTGLNAIYQ